MTLLDRLARWWSDRQYWKRTGIRTVYSKNWVRNGPHCCDAGWVSDGRNHDENCEAKR